ncbi:SusC/RagA family TonB-linked outer membrane protein [Butyricimonas paravirosa]|uniref:SusC/RagA family TonB-linked outer membrane protein n=1 Tax=Butyricimonas paravirosa TaxID=1472417 RepID=UPI0022E5716F|nr:SusC/RagA family TonB-linked outer membrane protein [Butyricimonas paravirosa]
MKTLLALFLFMNVSVVSTYAQQQKKMDISVDKMPLIDVLVQIRQMSGFAFVYDSDAVKKAAPVSLNMKNVTVQEILDKCFAGTSFTYLMEDKLVIIKLQKSPVVGKQVENQKIAGVVTDEKKMPLPGVTVVVKGVTLGTATDMNGRFSLLLPTIKDVSLLFSFIGMETTEVKYTGQDTINVVMKEEQSELSEVVVTGYQTIDRRKNTSAVQSIEMDKIKVPGVQTIDQLLESHVPGMIFMQNSGQVGAAPKLRIRGTSTILGNQEPVWVLDGIVLRDPVNVSPSLINNLDFVNLVGNAISGINPEDIERIDILKDASATALYGAKAANGVINITTKKGKAGPPSVTYSMNGKFTARPRYTDKSIYLMNSKERIAYSKEIIEKGLSYPTIKNWVGYEGALEKYNNGIYTYQQFTDEVARLETVNTDWFDLITEDVFSNSHTLSLSGGSSNVRYYASLGYSNEKGVIKGEKNDRYSASLNVNGNFNKFTFSFGMLANKGVREYVNSEVNILDYAYNTSRAIPAFNEDGSLYFYDVEGTSNASAGLPLAFNALHEMKNYRDEYNSSGVTLNMNLNYRFNDWLKTQFIFSYSINNTMQETFIDANSFYASNLRGTNYGEELTTDMKSKSLLPVGGEYREDFTRNDNYTTRLQFDFTKFLDCDSKHLINAALGFELASSKYDGKRQTHRGYLPERGKIFAEIDPDVYPEFTKWKMKDENARSIVTDNIQNEMSAYFTLTYTLNNAYSFNFNTRADASNKFGDRSNEKILPVWSVSASWDMKANILKDISWVNGLSVRGSFGYQGNMLSNQTPELIIKKGNMNNYFEEYESNIEHYPNPNLRWEKTGAFNGSVDFALLDNRIRGTFSYFYKKTKDAFLSKTVADINGVETYVINSGTLENKGFEISFNFTPFKAGGEVGGFRWDIDPQIGQVLNTLLTKAVNNNSFEKEQDEIFYTNYLDGSALIEGEPLNTFFSYKFMGLSPEDGRPMYYDVEKEHEEEYLEMDREEVFRRVMKVSGTRVPVLQGGVTNTFSYKCMSLSLNFAYSFGSKIRLMRLYGANSNGTTVAPLPERNVRREFVKRWQRPGDEKHTNIPGLLPNSEYASTLRPWWKTGNNNSINFADNIWQMYDNSDIRTVSGNYLKLQSFVFNYTLPDEFCKKLLLKSAYIGVSGSNLFTICSSKLKGQDPTQSGTTDQLNLSIRPSYSVNLGVTF